MGPDSSVRAMRVASVVVSKLLLLDEAMAGGACELVMIESGLLGGFCRMVDPSNAGESGSSRNSSSGGVSKRPTCSTEEEPSLVWGVGGC